MIKHDGNYLLSSQTFVGHVIPFWTKSQVTIFWISEGNGIQNLEIVLIETLQQDTIIAREHVIFARA
jgi:hypothetical protein